MNIGDVAKASELPVKTVRYYADIGLVPPSGRTAAGYRDFDDTALRKLILVRRSREFGFSVEDCRDLLALYEDRDRSNAEVKALARKRLDDIERKQAELQRLHDELAGLVKACRGDGRPDCPIIDYLG